MAAIPTAERPPGAFTATRLIRLRNILFATDFSSVSERALEYALAVARRYDARVFVAHVIAPQAYYLAPPDSGTTALELSRRAAEEGLAQILISGKMRDIPHQVLLGEGPLWTALSEMIRQHDIDLIVLGTHGRTGARKLLLGSVAEEIFRMSQCPVMTVGPKASGEVEGTQELRQIVYATDFSPMSESAAAYAFSLAQEHQARLTLLHVVKDAADFSEKGHAMLRDFTFKRLKHMVPPEAEFWCEPEFKVAFGQPATGILATAKGKDADLIVLGVRGGAAFPGHLPPATAYKVVCQAPCPVLTVRGSENRLAKQ